MAESVPILSTVNAALTALTGVTKEVTQRDSENNTPAMIAARVAQLTQEQKDAILHAIASGDLTFERKADSE